jgi:hypothetical protein
MYRQPNYGPQDLHVDPEAIARAQKAAARTRLIIVMVLLVALAGAGAGGFFFLQVKAKKQMKTAYGRFATCTIGGALKPDEKPSLRFRNLQLGAMNLTAEKRAANDVWPTRCASATLAFGEAVKDNAGSADLVAATEKLGAALKEGTAFTANLGAQVDLVFAKAKAAGWNAERATDIEAAPEPPTPLTLATLPKEAKFISPQTTLAGVHVSQAVESTLRFIVDEPNSIGPVQCVLAPTDTVIACKKIPAPAAGASPGLRMWGTTEPKAHVLGFAGDRGRSGIYDAITGARKVEKLEYGAYGASSLDDGSFGYLLWNEAKQTTDVVLVGPDGKSEDAKLVDRKESGNPYYTTALFWRTVAYKSVKKGTPGIRLVVRDLDPAAKTAKTLLSPPNDIGRIAESGEIEGGTHEDPHVQACRSGTTTVLRAKGWNSEFLYFKHDAAWSNAVSSPGTGGQLTCGDNTAMITRTFGSGGSPFHGNIEIDDCSVSECKLLTVDLTKLVGENDDVRPHDLRALTSIGVAGKLAIVWQAGDHAGIRMRIGRADAFATSTETIVLDDHIRADGYHDESGIVGTMLLPFDKRAVLLLGTAEGVYAYILDVDGKMTPLPSKVE